MQVVSVVILAALRNCGTTSGTIQMLKNAVFCILWKNQEGIKKSLKPLEHNDFRDFFCGAGEGNRTLVFSLGS